MAIDKYSKHKPLNPLFDVVMKGLNGLVVIDVVAKRVSPSFGIVRNEYAACGRNAVQLPRPLWIRSNLTHKRIETRIKISALHSFRGGSFNLVFLSIPR